MDTSFVVKPYKEILYTVYTISIHLLHARMWMNFTNHVQLKKVKNEYMILFGENSTRGKIK
jgi:hypothetical protein